MFPRFREQIGTALDLLVEFSTLGEYRLGADPWAGAAGAPADAPGHAPRLGGAGHTAERAAVRHTVAGGAAGTVPAATPAAWRGGRAAGPSPPAATLARGAAAIPADNGCGGSRLRNIQADRRTRSPAALPEQPRRRPRAGGPRAGEQLCLAV